MTWIALLTGWWMGLGSTGHCVGMCGPLALSLPFRDDYGRMDWWKYSLYHSGRVMTYIALGLIVGTIGAAFKWQGFSNYLSIVMGIILLIIGITYHHWHVMSQSLVPKGMSSWIASIWQATFKSKFAFAFVGAGAANGLLPCGMVYAAAMAALGTGSSSDALLVMSGFGIGTLPVFFLLPMISRWVSRYPKIWRYFVPLALSLTGIWLIMRGMPSIFQTHQCIDISPVPGLSPTCN